jgi:hypothetical protein
VGVPKLAKVSGVLAVVVRHHPRTKYRTRPATIASLMMTHNQGVLPNVDAGLVGF